MLNKDTNLLQEAYLSVIKKGAVNSMNSNPSMRLNKETVSTSPVKELAPGVDTEDHYSSEEECTCEETDTTGAPISMEVHSNHGSKMEGDTRFSTSDEDEEDDMTIDNLHSIKESLLKIAMAVSSGVHLEPWQQFKVAIVMDNLASVARSLARQTRQC